MRNITVSVPENVFRAARIWAAVHDTSLSGVVRCVLENLPGNREGLASQVTEILDSHFDSKSVYSGPIYIDPELLHSSSLDPDYPPEFSENG